MNMPGFHRVFGLIVVSLAIILSPSAHASVASATARYEAKVADARASMLTDPHATIARAQDVAVAARALDGHARVIGQVTSDWLEGEAYLRLNDAARAGPFIQRALQAVIRDPHPTKLTGDVLISLGGYHTATANVAAALADYQRAHNIFRDIGETRSQAIALLSIALLYQEAEDYPNALRYYGQARDVYSGDPSLQLAIFNNRGNALKELGRYAEAEAEFRQALTLTHTAGSPFLQVQVLLNIARVELLTRQLMQADRTIEQAASLARVSRLPEMNHIWSVAAQSALQHGRLQDAVQLVQRSFAGIDLRQTTLAYREGHRTAYEVFTRLGDERQALTHLEALKRLDDQTLRLAASANTSLAAARFDFANQELRILRLRQDELTRNIEFERARAATQRAIFIGLTVVTLLVVSMLAFGLVTLRRSRDRVRAANIDLGRTNTALEKALAAKTEFLATTSHEIRTPLNGILGMTQVMLTDRQLTPALRDRIGVVHGAGVTMRALVDDILDVAKMETGNLTLEEAPVDLPALLTDISRMWQEQARAKGIGFRIDLAECPAAIMSDAARLRQVVFNLMSNALKFTDRGEVSLTACRIDGEPAKLHIAIADSGIGVPADKLDLIFESFRQVDSGTTRRFGGTGLGLSICRNLARAMGGDVRVDSIAGEGSCFTLELPLILAAPVIAVIEQEPCALLIVDRNPISRSVLKAVLEKHFCNVRLADSVAAAVVVMGGGSIAAVLADEATLAAETDAPAAVRHLLQQATESGIATALLRNGAADASEQEWLAGFSIAITKPIAGAALAAALVSISGAEAGATTTLATHAA